MLGCIHYRRIQMTDQYHPLVTKILYGDVDEVPWDVIKDECLLDENGNVDVNWANELDEEQYLRVAIASTVQKWFNENK
jgi:hypothetical protein